MHIGVVNSALAAIDDELLGAESRKGSFVDRPQLLMTEKPPLKTKTGANATKAAGPESASQMNPAFDTWLEKRLHSMFDAVAAEPLPPDLLKLLETLDEKTRDMPDNTGKKSGK